MTSIRILIVEDDPMVAEITREFIREFSGFEVVGIAASGRDAVKMAQELTPQLILLDNFLPDFNGVTVVEKIRAVRKETDFIMITAAKEVPVVQECFRLGIRDYLIKPFLKQRLQQSLQNYRGFLETLQNSEVSQEALDRLGNSVVSGVAQVKGFSQLTEDKIIEILRHQTDGITAEEIASLVGITTVSARRYLKLLQDKNMVKFDLIYGKQGRPTYLFSIK